MKKKTINLLTVLLLSIILNTNCVKAEIISINGEQWDSNKQCVYKTAYDTITLYYKEGKTILSDNMIIESGDASSQYISSSSGEVSFTYNGVKYKSTNEIIVNNGCPAVIYRYSGQVLLGPMRSIYSAKAKSTWNQIWDFKITNKYLLDAKKEDIPNIDNSNEDTCDGIINATLSGLINKYLGYIHIIVPIMVLALGIFDFFKAVIASKEDEMKKAQKRFIIRLIAGVLVFLAPTIVNLIITVLNTGACTIG